jgi:hypothetical protein
VRRLLVGGIEGARVAALLAVWMLSFQSARPAAQSLAPDLVVRVYDAFGLAATERVVAAQAFESAFASAHINAVWRTCRAGGPDPCRDHLAVNEIVIRLVAAPAGDHGPRARALGYSSVPAGPKPGVIATVYPDRVRSLASLARREAGAILGAAIAHEAGHLLLGTTTHPPAGLMRAYWTARSLESDDPADRHFLTGEVSQLRAALAARARRQPAQAVWTVASLSSRDPIPSDH